MSSTITSLGVGSGLPLDTLLTQLQNNENTALQAIQTQQTTAQTTLSAYGKVQSAVNALQAAAQVLANANTYGALKTSVSSTALTASTSTGAIAGQYSVTVDQMAKAQTLVTTGQASLTQAYGTGGTITVTLNDGTTKTLDMTGKDTSLNGLVSAINGDPDLGISATLVNDGSSTPYHLLITANATGTQASVASISSSNSAVQGLMGFTQGTSSANISEDPAANATLHVNGIQITSQSNTVQDAIQGVTMNLSAVNTTPSILSITRDSSQTTQAVQNFVSAYNGLQSTIQSLTAYDTSTNTGSPLTGDSLARSVQSQVSNVLNTVVPTGTINNLYQLGININPSDGTLTVDSTKLSQALASNPGDVQNLLGGTAGVGSVMNTLTTNMLGTGGLFKSASDSLNQTLNDLQSQYSQTSDRINTVMNNYRQQFTALDTLVAQMNSVSSYLTQQLSSLGTSAKS